MRYSSNPEHLDIGGHRYTPASANATTFLILGGTVVHSREFHATLINGLRAMKSAADVRTAKTYQCNFSPPLADAELERFKADWTGVLGLVRTRNKAGRLWKSIPSGDGETISFLSLWASEASTTDKDLELLRQVFLLKTKVFVEWIDSRRTLILPAAGAS